MIRKEASPSGEGVRARRRAARPFALVGFACIVAGGLVAAATRPLHLEFGSWAAAYLVLVAGVAQLGFGVGQAWILADIPIKRWMVWEFAAWNSGNAAVMAGTFAGLPSLVAVGAVLLLVAMVLFLRAVRRPIVVAARWLVTYRVVAIVLAVSVLVGVVLSVIRQS